RPPTGTPPVRLRLRDAGAPRTQEERFTVRADQPRVVVTGLGATTPAGGAGLGATRPRGGNVTDTWEALLAGRSGARKLPADWSPVPLPVQIAAPAAIDPATALDRVQARRLDRCEQLALVAAREAWANAGAPEVDPF